MRATALALTLACTLTTTLCAQVTPWQTQIVASSDAQTLPEDRGADGLAQTLKKLHTWASVMIIVAHPDDEDGGMLTLESRGLGARTAIMTLTRGEGGQDAMTSSTEDELGLIRTNELLLCDQYSGSEQFFSRVADYGFSKTIEEAHQKWGRDRVLYDVVRAVRLYRPLIVTSTFVGGITDGHGHHQVSGEAAQEVFKLAGDPNVFPDQIAQGLRPWSPLKVYARAPFFPISAKGMFDYATGKWAPVRFYNYVTGQWSDKAPSTDVEIQEGAFDPILGRSYLQMAREGWSQQKSQFGGGNAALPGPYSVAYHLYGSRVSAASPTSGLATNFFDGIDITLPGIATLAHGDTAFLTKALRDIDQHVMTATFNYLPSNPEKIASELAIGYRKTKDLIDAVNASSLSSDDKANVIHELNIKLVQFNTALVEALGLRVNALMIPRTSDHPEGFGLSASETPTSVTPGSEFEVRLHVTSAAPWGTGSQLQLTRTWLAPPEEEHWTVARTRCARPRRRIEQRWRRGLSHHRPAQRGAYAAIFHAPYNRAALLRHRRPQPRQPALRALSACRMGRIHMGRSAPPHRSGRTDRASRARLWRPLSAPRGNARDLRKHCLTCRDRSSQREILPALRFSEERSAGNRRRHPPSRSTEWMDCRPS